VAVAESQSKAHLSRAAESDRAIDRTLENGKESAQSVGCLGSHEKLRMDNGILVEHWDVIQDEATEEQGPDVWLIIPRLFHAGENHWIICSSLR
jgi:predicted SnoaL-like aldol condensation-catalyzing enzyme